MTRTIIIIIMQEKIIAVLHSWLWLAIPLIIISMHCKTTISLRIRSLKQHPIFEVISRKYYMIHQGKSTLVSNNIRYWNMLFCLQPTYACCYNWLVHQIRVRIKRRRIRIDGRTDEWIEDERTASVVTKVIHISFKRINHGYNF